MTEELPYGDDKTNSIRLCPGQVPLEVLPPGSNRPENPACQPQQANEETKGMSTCRKRIRQPTEDLRKDRSEKTKARRREKTSLQKPINPNPASPKVDIRIKTWNF